MNEVDVLIIGAGPAGLTAGYKIIKKSNLKIMILEEDAKYVGGISRTEEYKGYRFDIGGHRFFSKSETITKLWNEILPNDFIIRPRKSRIYYKGQFYNYPLKAFEALINLGFFESLLCILSYIKAKILPKKNPTNFHDWVSNHFGERLFRIFFKSYTEKVWGIDCDEISSDWAAQRIKGLNMFKVIYLSLKNSLNMNSKNKITTPKTLINSFYYPLKGPGMMWEAAAKKIIDGGGLISMDSKLIALNYDTNHLWRASFLNNGQKKEIKSKYIISSMAIVDLINSLKIKLPNNKILNYSKKLKYRDYITVAIMSRGKVNFDDNWIYIHDPNVLVCRIQNFYSWSPSMIPNDHSTCLGLEYFCNENDNLWNKSDDDLKKIAINELNYLGLINKKDVFDGTVVRQKKAYPVYDDVYQKSVSEIKSFLKNNYKNIHLIGRNGMHKYNNQDHAMMTAILTVENILNGKNLFDVWKVNEDAEYHEAGLYGVKDALNSLRNTPTSLIKK